MSLKLHSQWRSGQARKSQDSNYSFNSSLTLAWRIVYLKTVQLQKYIWYSQISEFDNKKVKKVAKKI